MRTHLIGILALSVLFGAAAAGSRGGGRGEALAELGRRLFMDPTVSGSGKFSCASCHEPEHGFSDPRVLSEDVGGQTRRHSQPLLDLEQGNGFHWDGEFGTVRELVLARLAPPQEAVVQSLALHQRRFAEALSAGRRPDKEEFDRTVARLVPPYYGPPAPTTPGTPSVVTPLLARLGEDDRYARGFAEVFGGGGITTERVADALEAYLHTLRSTPNALDRFLAGDPDALPPAARRGLALFSGKASCASCHSLEGPGGGAPLTDGKFHNTGVSMRKVMLAFQGSSGADGGRGEMSFVADDLGSFKTPSLRDVGRRAPYMHDGSLATLEEVVRYYDGGGTPNGRLAKEVRPLRLTDSEVADLVAFLRALDGEERPGLRRAPEPRAGRVRLLDLTGRPLRGFAVEVHPFGDRFLGLAPAPTPLRVVTDNSGWLSFGFPGTTHAVLRAEGHEVGFDRPIPDNAGPLTLTVTPREKVSILLSARGGAGKMPSTIRIRLYDGGKPSESLTISLARVRQVGAAQALYSARVGRVTGVRQVLLEAGALGSIVCTVDLGGGASEPVHLGG